MAHAKQDIRDFRARLKQINNPRNTSYYDPAMRLHVPKRATPRAMAAKTQPSLPGQFLVSVILGGIAFMFAQAVRVRFFDIGTPADVTFYLDLLIAVWAVALVSAVLRRRRALERVAQIAGIGLMLTAGHNLIWRWPEPMAVVFTQAHVAQVMAETPNTSIVYRGAIYDL